MDRGDDDHSADTDFSLLASLFHDEAEIHSMATEAVLTNTPYLIKLFPFLLHSQRAIHTVLLDSGRSNFLLLRLYQKWRQLPTDQKQSWKDVSRELVMMQFSSEALKAAQRGFGKCKLRRLKEMLSPLRDLIPEFAVSETEFSENPFNLFKRTCLAPENIWIQIPVPQSSIDRRVSRRTFSTKRSPESIVQKLEFVKVCSLSYIHVLLQRPSLLLRTSVIWTQLDLQWLDNKLLRSFESVCALSNAELPRLLEKHLWLYLESWDVELFCDMSLKVKVVHAAVEKALENCRCDSGTNTEVISVMNPRNEIYLFLLQESAEELELRMARSLPWGVILVTVC